MHLRVHGACTASPPHGGLALISFSSEAAIWLAAAGMVAGRWR